MITTHTLMADFGCFGWRHRGPEDEVNPPLGGGTWDGIYWSDEDAVIDDSLRRDLCTWHARFEKGNSGSDENCLKFDWETFHAEGIALCHRLKSAFGPSVRIRYKKPMEDPGSEGRAPFQIESDGSVTQPPWDHELERQRLAQVYDELLKVLDAD